MLRDMEEKNDNQLNSITVCEDSDSSSENEATVENKRWKKRGTKALMGLVALVASASVALAEIGRASGRERV